MKMECDQLRVENKRSTKAEHENSLSKEFMRALDLLYSPEAESAEELRIMLEVEIAKQNRPKRSKLRTRQRRSKRQKTVADVAKKECEKSTRENNEISGKQADAACNLELNVDDVGNKDDIPRISIPDEDQNDAAVCKVCNVPEFGPLTLVQCEACEKYYHPLCHQPPIADVYSQESNSRWHCGECAK